MPALFFFLASLIYLRMLQLRVAFHNAALISTPRGIHHTYKRHSTCMAYTAFSYTVHGKVCSLQLTHVCSGY